MSEIAQPTEVESLYIAPTDKNLAGAEIELVGAIAREVKLKNAPKHSTKQTKNSEKPKTRKNFDMTCPAYINSEIQGNWGDFFAEELVEFVETNFRAKTGAQNRAIVGHSSGGDGVMKTLLLKPGVFNQGFKKYHD